MKVLSSRWAGAAGRALGSSTSDIQRLALALGPVRSVVRVIDNHVPPMSVDWARVGKDDKGRPLAMSYTDFAGGRVAVNPLPIFDHGDPGQAIDVVTGFAMHEASHGMHSRDRYTELVETKKVRIGHEWRTRETPYFRPLRLAAYLWNLVEDVRIEAETSKGWPGFAAYFDRVLDWMWNDMRERADMPTEYGPKVADKLRLVFLACRYPQNAIYIWTADKKMTAEAEWWQTWQADYLAGVTDTRETIRRGLDHLGEDPETQAEMDEMAAAEKKEEEKGERLRAQLDRLMREGVEGAFGVCINHEGDIRPLTEDEAESVNKLVREGLIAVKPVIKSVGSHCPVVRVSRPEESSESRRAYVGRPDAMVEALRAALVFRQARPQYDIKLQKSGELDDEELYRWSMDDYRLFTERVIEGRPDVLMGLLVDLSGSMSWGGGYGGSKLKTAQRLAQLMVWALHDQEGIETRVWGHTGDHPDTGSDVYRLWEPGDPLQRLGLISSLPHGNNYDGFALEYVVGQMRDLPQPQKVVIVLSDGLPAGDQYGNAPARRHVRMVADWARGQGVNVIQVAIDDDLRMSEQADMYGVENIIGFKSEADLPKQLTKVLARWS